jgi:antitoxin component YwqK of YwqJK toxin-antitoxin module
LPESEEHYIVKITYIDGNKISYAYTSGGPTVVEIKLANHDFMMIQAFSNNTWKCASIAFYNNRILDGAPYFYYPDLEVIVQDGLY